MTKSEGLRIGLALNHIAMILDTASYEKVQPYLNTIEQICLKNIEEEEKDGD